MPAVTGDDGTPSGIVPNAPFGVWGDSGSAGPFGGGGNGVFGSSSGWSGVKGQTSSGSPGAAGVFGLGVTVGVAGQVQGANTQPGDHVGVYGTGSDGAHLGATGVEGVSDSGSGVLGESITGTGVTGLTRSRSGVLGVSSEDIGVFGISNGTGVIGWGGAFAGEFFGDVDVSGSLTKGGGGFKVDHPLDPTNRYLSHSFVESAERKNIYDGVATLSADGSAVVELPGWFEALNEAFRYQLTSVGGPAPRLHIGAEVAGNSFAIAGGEAGMRVSWQVTGTRRDPWAQSHPMAVEEDKSEADRGRYRHPEAHGRTSEEGMWVGRRSGLPGRAASLIAGL